LLACVLRKIAALLYLQATGGGKKAAKAYGKDKQPAFQHPWLMTSLKGHSGRVLDLSLSENGKMLATCADDRSILIWCRFYKPLFLCHRR
jgi:WD domain, G-beta repeat